MASVIEKRMLTEKEAQIYLNMSRATCRKFGEDCGAVKKIGRKILYDKPILDKALENLEPHKCKSTDYRRYSHFNEQ